VGWYFRRSVRLGPLRINFSKSGIGYSVGMKGLRVGKGPRGPYVAGGRYGLYFRQSLKSAPQRPTISIAAPCSPSATPEIRLQEPSQSQYCTNCGTRLVPGNQFCIECGAKCDLSSQLSEVRSKHVSFGRLALLGLAAATVFILFKIALSIL
jgi:hypothetical protein